MLCIFLTLVRVVRHNRCICIHIFCHGSQERKNIHRSRPQYNRVHHFDKDCCRTAPKQFHKCLQQSLKLNKLRRFALSKLILNISQGKKFFDKFQHIFNCLSWKKSLLSSKVNPTYDNPHYSLVSLLMHYRVTNKDPTNINPVLYSP